VPIPHPSVTKTLTSVDAPLMLTAMLLTFATLTTTCVWLRLHVLRTTNVMALMLFVMLLMTIASTVVLILLQIVEETVVAKDVEVIPTVLTPLPFVKMTTNVVVTLMLTVMLETSVTLTPTNVRLSARRIMNVMVPMKFAMRFMTTVSTVALHQIVMILDVAQVVVLMPTVYIQNLFVKMTTIVAATQMMTVRLETFVIQNQINVRLSKVPIS